MTGVQTCALPIYSHDTYEFSITAGAGTDLQSLEKSVRAMLARIENEKKARQRSKLSDLE